jgi:WD40 repeat protein
MDEQGNHIVLWNLAESFASQTGKIQNILGGYTNPVLEIAYTPDGTRLATGSLDGSTAWSLTRKWENC